MCVCTGPQPLESEILAHPSAALYVELGNRFTEYNQPPCSIQAFRAGLKLVPDSGALSYLLGLAYYSTGNPKGAIVPLQQSIRAAPQAIESYLLLGAAFDKLQLKEKARVQFESALHIDPHSITALHGLSRILIEQGNYAAAIKILRSTPGNELLALDLAHAYEMNRMYDRAGRILLDALRGNSSSFSLVQELIVVYVHEKRYLEAVQLAGKALRLHPRVLEAQNLYLRTLVLNHEFDKAGPLAETLLADRPHDFEAVYTAGMLELAAGQYAIARQRLEEAVLLNPTHFKARYNLGIVLAELKDFAAATEQWKISLDLGPGLNEPQVRYRLGNALRMLGENEQAKQQFRLTEQELQIMADKSLHQPFQGC